MSKIIPITEKQLIRFQKTFYKFDEVSFVGDSSGYVGWDFGDCFYDNDKLFLDTSVSNEILICFYLNDMRKFVRKILK